MINQEVENTFELRNIYGEIRHTHQLQDYQQLE